MKYLVSFFVILILLFHNNLVRADTYVVYLNIDKIMNESEAGKSLNKKFEKFHENNIIAFKVTEDSLKKEEDSLLAQKNILSNEDFVKKLNSLKLKVNEYKKIRQEKINDLTKKRVEASNLLLSEMNKILTNYAKEKNISIILQKKNVVLAKTELDITNDIMKILNINIKSIDLN